MNKNKFLIINSKILAVALLFFSFTLCGYSADFVDLKDDVPESALKEAIDYLSSYKDVPSSVSCKKPKTKGEKIICKSSYLRKMELLATRASAYSEENATSQELNHKKFKNPMLGLIHRSNEKAIRQIFKEQINLGLYGWKMSNFFKE